MLTSNPRQLIVEGIDDRHSVVGLMRAHVDWPSKVEDAPVYIDLGGGAEEMLQPAYLTAKIKTPYIKMLGVMLDADSKPLARYERLRNACLSLFPMLPDTLPRDGLIAENDDRQRLGVWIMPDNISEGYLETFLRFLVPDGHESIWEHATQSVHMAKSKGAKCRDVHDPKAHLYTWLAWQDPPGQSPGIALTKKILDPHSTSASGFVKWFRELYGI